MLWIFNRNEELVAVLKNEGTALPYIKAVHLEQLNQDNRFQFSIPANHPDSDKVIEGGMVAYQDNDGDFQLFEIKRIEEIHGAYLQKNIYAEHAVYELLDEFIEDKRPTDASAYLALTDALMGTRWSVGTVEDLGTASVRFYRENPIAAIQKIIEAWDCEVRYRVEVAGSRITNRYIDLFHRRGVDNGKRFEYEKDMEDVKRTIDATNVKTALYGFGKGEETGDGYGRRIDFSEIVWSKADGDPLDKPAGQKWIGDPTALSLWGRSDGTRHRFGEVEYPDSTDTTDLLWKTYVQLKKVMEPNVSYEMTVADLEELTGLDFEKIRLGDTVRAIDKEFVPELRVTARVIEIERVLHQPEETKVVLGNFVPNITNNGKQIADLTRSVHDNQGIWSDAISSGARVSWLDGIIQGLTEEASAAGGYVYLTEEDGISIYDAPIEQATSVLRLKGGIFSISNTKDVNGNWVWRTFGDGDGFTADEITAGQMLFDRAKGGTLLLGGSNNDNGRMLVYNADGDVIGDLDAAYGGFYSLHVGQFSADNVLNSNNKYMLLFVNPVSGSDNNDGSSSTFALQRLQVAIDKIPKHNNDLVEIYVTKSSFNEHEVRIEGFYGKGRIIIYFQDATLNGMVYIYNNNQRIDLNNGFVNQIYGTEYLRDGTISIQRTHEVYLTGMDVYSRRNVDFGVRVRSSYCQISDCNFYDSTTAGVNAEYGGIVDIVGNCTGSGGWAGIRAIGTGRIAVHNVTVPAGTVGTEVANGGVIGGTISSHEVGTPLILDAPPITNIFSAQLIRSWNTKKGWNSGNNFIYQGEWSDTNSAGTKVYYGNYKGCFYFDNDAILTAIQGKTLVSARVKLRRLSYGGYPGAYTAQLWTVTSKQSGVGVSEPVLDSNLGGGTTFSWGEEDWIGIPLWVITGLTNGSYGGFALYFSNGTNYMILDEYAQLEITYK